MNGKRLVFTIAFGALTVALAGNANALTININAGAGLSGNASALAAFQRAATTWEAIFSDAVTIEIDADLSASVNGNLFAPSVIGSTNTKILSDGYTAMRNNMVADAANEASNGIVAFLPTSAQFSAQVPLGFSVAPKIFASKANMKALGYDAATLDTFAGTTTDATITFNSGFSFDFDNSNGVSAGSKDFETVAAHELGHALGFISIVDVVDEALQNNATGTITPTTLDLFRFNPANDPMTAGGFSTGTRELRPGEAAVFSDVTNQYAMSTGTSGGGDGNQASHWKADELTGSNIGLFDPTLGNGVVTSISAADIRALDLIGWDIAIASVPAPASFAILGFGLGSLALAARRRRRD